jgi:hypothetical protein
MRACLVGVDTKRFYWGGHVATCLLLYIMEDETGVDALLAKVFSVFFFALRCHFSQGGLALGTLDTAPKRLFPTLRSTDTCLSRPDICSETREIHNR